MIDLLWEARTHSEREKMSITKNNFILGFLLCVFSKNQFEVIFLLYLSTIYFKFNSVLR